MKSEHKQTTSSTPYSIIAKLYYAFYAFLSILVLVQVILSAATCVPYYLFVLMILYSISLLAYKNHQGILTLLGTEIIFLFYIASPYGQDLPPIYSFTTNIALLNIPFTILAILASLL